MRSLCLRCAMKCEQQSTSGRSVSALMQQQHQKQQHDDHRQATHLFPRQTIIVRFHNA